MSNHELSTSESASIGDAELPSFTTQHFAITNAPECDVIMKGGITSGMVYPYAILQIATKYRFRSIGGTSAGAIAAAFAAAAEYARQNGRPEGFLVLQQYCNELPDLLRKLFQPIPELKPAADFVETIMVGGVRVVIRRAVQPTLLAAILGAIILGLLSRLLSPDHYVTALAVILGTVVGATLGFVGWAKRKFLSPLMRVLRQLPKSNFGFCTGLTQPDHSHPALTNWVYEALQHIAFGKKDHPTPLTFGDLQLPDQPNAAISLKIVTTNLSMRRPHTLPRLGVKAAFLLQEWKKLFPEPVMAYLCADETRRCEKFAESWLFPKEEKLPVIVAVRMSLSFPLLFTAVPLKIEDAELSSIMKSLGGQPENATRTVHFSDGGISSNFPIHMFDAPLPVRPTFAFSLDDLLCDASKVKNRVALPENASQGMGVQIKEIRTLSDFGWQIISSAKDWQDQLLSEITGQRERIIRIFLADGEGGLNLSMQPQVSRQLMKWGYDAGCKFTNGSFDFDEHRWRRLLALYKHMDESLEAINETWHAGYKNWYDSYKTQVKTYVSIHINDRNIIATNLCDILAQHSAARPMSQTGKGRLPKKVGTLKIAPKY